MESTFSEVYVKRKLWKEVEKQYYLLTFSLYYSLDKFVRRQIEDKMVYSFIYLFQSYKDVIKYQYLILVPGSHLNPNSHMFSYFFFVYDSRFNIPCK